ILFRNAESKGARVVEGCEVRDVDFAAADRGVVARARHDDGRIETLRTRFVLDASGRDTFLGNRFKAKQRNKKHNSAAIYAHFSGGARNPGKAAGNISIFWFQHGWFWFIPLVDGVTSVGAVVWPYYLKTRKQKSLELFFEETIALCAPLKRRLQYARLASTVEATGNYSYVCDRTHGSDYLLLGDAYTFIDPVFSSGVMLAMQSAFAGVETVDVCLRDPARANAALRRFDQTMRLGPKEFSWFVYRVTNPILRDMFMEPGNIFRVKEALLSMLAGDVFGDTPIRRRLLVFKGLYYVVSLLNIRRALKSWRMRKHNIRVVDESSAMMQ
ncbi:MAG: tryptophan 7-halogenase, partial [Arenicellales bacterium]